MSVLRRALLRGLAASTLAGPVAAQTTRRNTMTCPPWPAWEAFKRNLLTDDGRIAERDTGRTVSEAQAYALFFALVANDRAVFDRLLTWTEDNLAAGDLTARLPAWHWGRRIDGSWGVIDNNPASDADLWMAHTLGEAGRLWSSRRLVAIASLIADRVLREETAVLPGLGLTLLPGPKGFVLPKERWRLNPSYLPLFQLRWLAARSGSAAWQAVLDSSLAVLHGSAPKGVSPDWAVWAGEGSNAGRFVLDEQPADDREGGYNAIRGYLWLGLTDAADAAHAALLQQHAPVAELIARAGFMPEKIDPLTLAFDRAGPPGFTASVLPFLQALGRRAELRQQQARLEARPPQPEAYYDQVLALFATGAMEGRYRFAADGSLLPAWTACRKPEAGGR